MTNKSKQVNDWYIKNYQHKSHSRFETFRLALTMLYENTNDPSILETGCVRQENDFGAGYSTYIFGECISLFGGQLVTVDITPHHIETCKLLTKQFCNNITYIVDDSLNFLKNYSTKIDLIYLDSYDCPIEGDASDSQKHNLNEFLLVENKLHNKSLVLIDDVDFPNGGKAKMTHDYLKLNNYTLIHTQQQSLWHKKI